MKIKFSTAIINQKNNNLLHKVRKFFIEKTKPLANDSFEKNVEKQAEKKVIISRKHPNWCDMPEDGYKNNTIAETICYYPEDIEKMKNMTKKEKHEYKDYLDKQGRFYYGETLTKEEHEAFMRSLGLDPEQFYIRKKK